MTNHSKWDTHKIQARNEDIEFLTSMGVSLEDACARVGIEVGAYEKQTSRERVRRRPVKARRVKAAICDEAMEMEEL